MYSMLKKTFKRQTHKTDRQKDQQKIQEELNKVEHQTNSHSKLSGT